MDRVVRSAMAENGIGFSMASAVDDYLAYLERREPAAVVVQRAFRKNAAARATRRAEARRACVALAGKRRAAQWARRAQQRAEAAGRMQRAVRRLSLIHI